MGSPVGKFEAGVYSLFRLENWDAGLNTSASTNAIADNELTEMENFVVSEKGVLKKRNGLRRMNPQELQAEITIDFGSPDQEAESNITGHLGWGG